MRFHTMLTLCFLIFFSLPLYADQRNATKSLSIVTGELPPYSWMENNQLFGVATEIVLEIMKEIRYPLKIDVKPWARTIMESHKHKRMSYPLARLPYREKQYQWIGPILKDKFVFAVLDGDKRTFNHILDFQDLKIGVNRGAPTAKRLQKLGFKNLQIVSSEEINGKKLLTGSRFDAWYSTRLMIFHTLSRLNVKKSRVRIVYEDLEIKMYVVASLDVEKQTITDWQQALNKMKRDGTYHQILKRHGIGN